MSVASEFMELMLQSKPVAAPREPAGKHGQTEDPRAVLNAAL